MRKIGILTFHWADDYGAMLQAYGLKAFLETQGCTSEILPYAPLKCTGRYWLFPYILKINNAGKRELAFRQITYRLQKNIRMLPIFLQRKKNMRWFRRNYLTKATAIRTVEKLSCKEYECILVGSDQVWNPELTLGLDDAYLGKIKKEECRFIAYAASFGGAALPNAYAGELQKAFEENFAAISLREQGAVPYVQSLTAKTIDCTLDPTLLLPKVEWEKVAKQSKERNYILVYNTAANEEVFEYAYRLAKEKNCRVIRISSFLNRLPKKYSCFENNLVAGPAEFLGLFAGADYVVTNSFHGTVFSVIFEKKFVVFGYAGRSLRITDFLKKMKLEQHFIENLNQPVVETIDWNSVKEALEKERKASVNFLRQNILRKGN